ncbi:MAG TPA: alpha/beta hydrolase [Chloroflexi bacterium]|nr:alpha/beta hydrolase [Chloroflexota bacterium]
MRKNLFFSFSCQCNPHFSHHISWLLALLLSLITPTLAWAQAPSASFAGVYKAWSSTPETGVIDSTLYLNLDGSALLVDKTFSGAPPTTRTGQWAPGGTGVILTLTGGATGALPQPIVVNLDASAGQPLVTLPGDLVLDGRSWRFYALPYLAENRNALAYNADIVSSVIATDGLAGVYKTITPNPAGGWREVTLTLSPDSRALLARDTLDGRAPTLTYGAWQDISGQPLLTFTESDGVAFTAPAELSFTLENGRLFAQSTAASELTDLVGAPFYRVEGLASAVAVAAIGGVSGGVSAGISAPPVAAPNQPEIALQYAPSFETTPCPTTLPVDSSMTCGLLSVPENRRRADSSTIRRLAITLAADSATPATDPVVVLSEGADADMAMLIEWFATAPVRSRRPVILLAPRGAEMSEPSLACPDAAATNDRQVVLQALAACYNRLRQEARDLTGYTLEQSALDVIDLAKALSAPQLNLVGSGRGAAVAQLVAARQPALVRALVLESLTPIRVNSALEAPIGAYDALRTVFADCARAADCAAAYPDLEARFLAVIDWYNQTPTPASIGFGDGDAIARLIFARLQSEGGRDIPALIDAFYTGNFGVACKLAPVDDGCQLPATGINAPASGVTTTTSLPDSTVVTAPLQSWRAYFTNPDAPQGAEAETLDRMQRQLGFATREELVQFLDTLAVENFLPLLTALGVPAVTPAPPLAAPPPVGREGMSLILGCAEDAAHYTIDDVQRVRNRLPEQVAAALTAPATWWLEACSAWPAPAAPVGDRILPLLTPPTLIMGGAHDPVTPARWARQAAADFVAPVVRIFAHAGHNLLQSADGCAQQALAAFVARPGVVPNLYCFRRQDAAFALPSP